MDPAHCPYRTTHGGQIRERAGRFTRRAVDRVLVVDADVLDLGDLHELGDHADRGDRTLVPEGAHRVKVVVLTRHRVLLDPPRDP